MTKKSYILGGAAIVALTCSSVVTASAQQTNAPAGQTDQATPNSTPAPDATGNQTNTPAPAMKHRHRHHATSESRENAQEALQTQKLNQQQLASSQNQQGSYGGQQSTAPASGGANPTDQNNNSPAQNMTTAPQQPAPSGTSGPQK
jgi:hypothetical protein